MEIERATSQHRPERARDCGSLPSHIAEQGRMGEAAGGLGLPPAAWIDSTPGQDSAEFFVEILGSKFSDRISEFGIGIFPRNSGSRNRNFPMFSLKISEAGIGIPKSIIWRISELFGNRIFDGCPWLEAVPAWLGAGSRYPEKDQHRKRASASLTKPIKSLTTTGWLAL